MVDDEGKACGREGKKWPDVLPCRVVEAVGVEVRNVEVPATDTNGKDVLRQGSKHKK